MFLKLPCSWEGHNMTAAEFLFCNVSYSYTSLHTLYYCADVCNTLMSGGLCCDIPWPSSLVLHLGTKMKLILTTSLSYHCLCCIFSWNNTHNILFWNFHSLLSSVLVCSYHYMHVIIGISKKFRLSFRCLMYIPVLETNFVHSIFSLKPFEYDLIKFDHLYCFILI